MTGYGYFDKSCLVLILKSRLLIINYKRFVDIPESFAQQDRFRTVGVIMEESRRRKKIGELVLWHTAGPDDSLLPA